ncbi:S8 family serine peptidase (plasmid) [Staphylococcus haemolyticus]|uniref:S8 family serine peptidase n=1 Tax=Staphylococcus haemolyticus TaxID=1283 RepID=UPI001375231C|nr:S8 family serine peptidase [Staphylococcus haemolyticus]QUX20065.1 S8 family serine peptidase [Staphylococcus haemolyticus]UCI01030.1 S8 family serine peptidase [Staphylococcus haemolyticus]UCI03239.1 S8 family serine peptidase [Staphylococcus haemolyticus]
MDRYEIIFKKYFSLKKLEKFFNRFNNYIFLKEINIAYVSLTHEQYLKIKKIFSSYIYIHPLKNIKIEPREKVIIKLDKLKQLKKSIMNKQWDIKKITNNRKSYRLHSITNNISIGIIDSGVDTNHIDLYPSMLNGSKNFVTNKINDIHDYNGHGTAVVGQIAANGIMKGVAPGIGFRVYKVFDTKHSSVEWIIRAIIAAVNDKNNIINLSVGQYLNINNENQLFLSYRRAIKYAYENNVIIVTSLGNDGINLSEQNELKDFIKKKNNCEYLEDDFIVDCPNYFETVVSVGSIDSLDNLTYYSNYNNYNKELFLSYGGDDKTIIDKGIEFFMKNQLFIEDWVISTNLNNGYFYFYGNSFATPKVASTIALIIDKYKIYNSPNLAIEHLIATSSYHTYGLIINTYNSLKPKKLLRRSDFQNE